VYTDSVGGFHPSTTKELSTSSLSDQVRSTPGLTVSQMQSAEVRRSKLSPQTLLTN